MRHIGPHPDRPPVHAPAHAPLPRAQLIRVCEAQAHWRELATLYIQYDEYDNAAQTMMLHADAPIIVLST